MLKTNLIRCAFAAAVVGAGCATPALASEEEFTPAETLAPLQRAIDGKAADLLGIKTGMRCSEAFEILKTQYSEKAVERSGDFFSADYRGVSVTTPGVVTYMKGRSADKSGASDNLNVVCSGLASSNQVIEVSRYLDFGLDPFKAPTMVDADQNLLAKYGEPSAHAIKATGSDIRWVYVGGKKVACDPNASSTDIGSCIPASTGPYSPDVLETYLEDPLKNEALFINAHISPNHKDPSKASSIKILILDTELRRAAVKADIASLQEEAQRRYNKESKPVAVPKF